MEFDSVGRDPGLSVEDVEEADSGDRRLAGEVGEVRARGCAAGMDESRPGCAHLLSVALGRTTRAGVGRELDDHRQFWRSRLADHEMDVAVFFDLHLHERRAYPEGAGLNARVPGGAKVGWRVAAP